jgi:hypothetical protein
MYIDVCITAMFHGFTILLLGIRLNLQRQPLLSFTIFSLTTFRMNVLAECYIGAMKALLTAAN